MLKLFLAFLKIGAISFGGGYGMISLIREEVLSNGWLTEEELLNMIAISESTPGPIAINMATFIGSSQYGILGAFFATIAVILPAFLIILLVTTILSKVIKNEGVQAFLKGLTPAVVALIIGTALIMIISRFTGIDDINSEFNIDYKGIIIFAILVIVNILFKVITKKKLSPIVLIIISALLGLVIYAI